MSTITSISLHEVLKMCSGQNKHSYSSVNGETMVVLKVLESYLFKYSGFHIEDENVQILP